LPPNDFLPNSAHQLIDGDLRFILRHRAGSVDRGTRSRMIAVVPDTPTVRVPVSLVSMVNAM
jgi:hypothetical protein